MLGIIAASCRKNDAATAPAYVATESDAAAIVTNDISPAYGGLVSQLTSCLKTTSLMSCGTIKDTVFKAANVNTSAITFNYQFQSRNIADCGSKSSTITFTGTHNYEGSTFVNADHSTGSIVLTDNPLIKTTNQLNLNFKRSGNQRIKGLEPHIINSTVEIKSTNIITDKLTGKIISGTASVTFYNTDNAVLYAYNATLNFAGNNRATLLFSSGNSYYISW